MSPLYLYNGKLLTVGGSLAINANCCCDNNFCYNKCEGWGRDWKNRCRENSLLQDREYIGYIFGLGTDQHWIDGWESHATQYCGWKWDFGTNEWYLFNMEYSYIGYPDECFDPCRHPSEWATPPSEPLPGFPEGFGEEDRLWISFGYVLCGPESIRCLSPGDPGFDDSRVARSLKCNKTDSEEEILDSCEHPCPDCSQFNYSRTFGEGAFQTTIESYYGCYLHRPLSGRELSSKEDAELCCQFRPTQPGDVPDTSTPEGLRAFEICDWDWFDNPSAIQYKGDCKIVEINPNEWVIYTCGTTWYLG